MPWISLGRWSSAHGALFTRNRIYWNGCRWTPIVLVSWRYTPWRVRPTEEG